MAMSVEVPDLPDERFMRITQPVLLQSFEDEFNLPNGPVPRTPAQPNTILTPNQSDQLLSPTDQALYRKGTGKLMYLLRSRTEIRNAVRELSGFMQSPTVQAMDAMYRVMKYCLATPNWGLYLKPTGTWDGRDRNYEFVLRGRSDSEYAKCPITRKSVGGYSTFLNDAPVVERSKKQGNVAMSVTEAEFMEAASCAQELLAHKRLLESLGLKVQLPMILEVDNKGAVDLVNNWSSGGRTKHIDVRYYFLRDLKHDGLLKVMWIPSEQNSADIFTKNVMGPLFHTHANVYLGKRVTFARSNSPEGESVVGGSGLLSVDGFIYSEEDPHLDPGERQADKPTLLASTEPNTDWLLTFSPHDQG